jgi:hypothetical protein
MGGIEGVRSTMAGRLVLAGTWQNRIGQQVGKRVRIAVQLFAKHNYCLPGCGGYPEYLSAN